MDADTGKPVRGVINDAIEAWRDGETLDAVHPLNGSWIGPDERGTWLWDLDAVKDLARVIARHLEAAQAREDEEP